MPWFKVDDALAMHMKAFTAGNRALGLWVRAGSWSMHQLSDGFIPKGVVVALGGDWDDAAALINAGLWNTADGGYQFHDWAEYQPTREQVLTEREAAAERMRRVRANKRENDGRTNGDRSGSPSRPVPTPDSSKTYVDQSSNDGAKEPTDSVLPMTERLAGQAGLTLPAIVRHVDEHVGRRITPEAAYQVGSWLLGKAKTYPARPHPYVMRSITMSSLEVQQFIDENGLAS